MVEPVELARPSVPTRFADLSAAPELVAVITTLRPPVVTAALKSEWYRAIANTEVVEWLRHIYFFGDDADRRILVLIVPDSMIDPKVFDAARRYLIPLIFDELTDRAGRRAKRELKAAGLTAAVRSVVVNRRLKPMLRT